MKNAMHLKAVVKNIAKAKNISAQLVLQNYMLERFLENFSVTLEYLFSLSAKSIGNFNKK